jgi:D-alanyl-D-alanine carboxypeptidase
VYSEEGWWAGASGYSKTENKTPMNICHLQYTQSVSKTYMAVCILQLHEQGKIDLNAPITRYLPAKYKQRIKNADQITVRMLLSHTSGIAEYNSDPEFTASVMLHAEKVLNMDDVLQCLADDEPMFAPGSKYTYCNTNFALLALIGDVITGDHGKYIKEHIFKPLELNNSYYQIDKHASKYPTLTDTYWDVLNAGRPANISPMQQANVASMVGDDGIICTPVDAVKFLKGLMEGKLLKDSSLIMMEQWVKNDEGREVYGLGLIRFVQEGLVGYGHGGGGIGAGCMLIYVPEKKVYVFLATNVGVIWEGDAPAKANEMKNALLKAILL